MPDVVQDTMVGSGGLLNMISALFCTAPCEALIMVHPRRAGVVVNVTVPITAPALIVTLAGTMRSLLVDSRFTIAVDEGAARVTVHVPEPPGTTLLGAQTKADRIAVDPFNATVRALDDRLYVAVSVAI